MNTPLNCICIDDEPLALEVMQALIDKQPELKLLTKTTSALQAIELIGSGEYTVAFTDINMPEVSGLDFARAVQKTGILVVFTTAHQEYAAEAFEIEALDYLLKPISPERFEKSVNKIKEYLELRKNRQKENVEMDEGHIFVKSDSRLLKISYADILFVEAFADYVKIWISEDKRIVTLQTMKNMENGLPSDRFLRVHRSFIAAIDKIEEVQSNSIRIGSKSLPLGKNYKEKLMELIGRRKIH